MEKKRCFIALNLKENLLQDAVNIQEKIKEKGIVDARYTSKENMHLTLKFLGEIEQEKIEKIKKLLKDVRFRSFPAKFIEVGVFSRRFIKIIWLKINGKEVYELQEKIDKTIKQVFEKEKRFMGHVTIARVKNIKDKKEVFEFIDKIKPEGLADMIDSFSLIQSTLTPQGSVYEEIERYGLG